MPIQPNKSGGKTIPPTSPPSDSVSDNPLGKTTTRKVEPSDIDPALNRLESGYESLTSKPALDSRSTSVSPADEDLELDDDAFESRLESDFDTDGASGETETADEGLDGGRLEFENDIGSGDTELDDGVGEAGDDSVVSTEGGSLKGFDGSRECQVGKDPIARGAFGKIYLVTQEEPPSDSSKVSGESRPHKYVLKTERADYGLKNEKRILENLPPHKNIVGYHGAHSLQGKEGLVLDHVDGPRLFSLIEDICEETEVSAGEAFNAVKFLQQQMLESLDHLHEHGVVHADIKGSNFMFDKANNEVKLIDFWLVRPIRGKILRVAISISLPRKQ